MNRLISAATAALLLANTAWADTRAVSCDGCSAWQMSGAATETTGEGTVYVFNGDSGEVRKYQVITEWVDTMPPTRSVSAFERSAEWSVRNAFNEFIDSRVALQSEPVITLPPGFEVRSVAGALLDGEYASTSIENHLRTLAVFDQHLLDANVLVAKLLQVRIAGFDLSNVLRSAVITVEFPDGSTMDFRVDYSFNVLVPSATIALSPDGNARTADGRAAPSHPYAFRGRTFNDDHGALQEWIFLARQLGIPINGSGTTMTCEIEGNEIVCVVRMKP